MTVFQYIVRLIACALLILSGLAWFMFINARIEDDVPKPSVSDYLAAAVVLAGFPVIALFLFTL